MLAQQRVELRFDRADRNEVAAGAFIDAVEMRAAVEEILVAALGPAPASRVMSKNIDISDAAPSHIAVSTTWPLPDFEASSMAASTPTTR